MLNFMHTYTNHYTANINNSIKLKMYGVMVSELD